LVGTRHGCGGCGDDDDGEREGVMAVNVKFRYVFSDLDCSGKDGEEDGDDDDEVVDNEVGVKEEEELCEGLNDESNVGANEGM